MLNRVAVAGGLARCWLVVAALLVIAFSASTAWAAPAEKRVALVIGNGAYRYAPTLRNAPGDARLMAETLNGLGFRLIGDGALIDLERPAMEQAIRSFGRALREGAVGVFYYSGHGLQIRGTNFMIPVSAKVATESDVKYELVDVSFVLDEMGNAGNRLNILILDACRNNPLGGRGLRSVGDGLATMTAPAGTAIAFATQPGNVARDGDGSHSPYTQALAQAIRTPGLDLFDTFNDVGLAVKKATSGQQQPWLSSSPIEGRFYFAGGGTAAVTVPDNTAEVDRAKAEIARLKREADNARAAIERANAEAAAFKRRQVEDEVRTDAKRQQAEADAIDEFRACKSAAKANQEASDQLKAQFDRLKSGWESLQSEKERLDATQAQINANQPYDASFFRYLANTQFQTYNTNLRELTADKDDYNRNKNALSSKIERFNARCAKSWNRRVIAAGCGDSDDSFCSELAGQ